MYKNRPTAAAEAAQPRCGIRCYRPGWRPKRLSAIAAASLIPAALLHRSKQFAVRGGWTCEIEQERTPRSPSVAPDWR
jgi:hypothetical protein